MIVLTIKNNLLLCADHRLICYIKKISSINLVKHTATEIKNVHKLNTNKKIKPLLSIGKEQRKTVNTSSERISSSPMAEKNASNS